MTQNDRILWILADGAFHEKSEFYSFCVLHSRISELRKRGYTFEIEKRHGGRTVWYRLASAPLHERTDAVPLGRDSAFAHGEGAALPLTGHDDPGRSLSGPVQLSLEA